MSDNDHYLLIAEELKTNSVDPVLWIQAKASAGGDRDKTEAVYIRLRFADLKKKSFQQSHIAPTVGPNSFGGDLSRMRSDLAKQLLMQGKKSLYSVLNLHPDATDLIIKAAIADIELKNLDHLNISHAEFKYAKDTLGNPELREQYDRQLLNSLLGLPKPYLASSYEDDTESSWWESRKTSVIVGVFSIAVLGYLGLGYWRESHTSNLQKNIVDLAKDTTHSATDIEQTKVQADIELKEKMFSLQAQRQKQELEIRARTTDQMLEQQRLAQEARASYENQRQEAEQKRQQTMKEQAENRRLEKERQYYVCLNQQMSIKLSQRDGSGIDAYARCAMYRN